MLQPCTQRQKDKAAAVQFPDSHKAACIPPLKALVGSLRCRFGCQPISVWLARLQCPHNMRTASLQPAGSHPAGGFGANSDKIQETWGTTAWPQLVRQDRTVGVGRWPRARVLAPTPQFIRRCQPCICRVWISKVCQSGSPVASGSSQASATCFRPAAPNGE
ncbi:hypothetical protein N657DRAFT_251587 [Parathielavia appendiculata]|uniref:Uncharacterized protein n=1 Tax=Parathielavia appendiculata TaxID=2587402 RepID=A0AAN6TSV2_9PEZI|nr:hypothetical protein N657DRAFT_251587 [Parathielavia appendiculata]